MGLAEALPGPLVGSLLLLWLLDVSGACRAGANGSESMGEKGRERRALREGFPKSSNPFIPPPQFWQELQLP